jgi:hypothetical protein
MESSSVNRFATSPRANPLARLGASHGYRFNADSVSINAMFTVLADAAHQRDWALQLWACSSAPASALQINGHLIAQAPLPPIGEVADETLSFELDAFAHCPPGGNEFVIVLALVAEQDGKFTDVHDYFAYPRAERFFQPRLAGETKYRVEGRRVLVSAERIENPRDLENLSGSLKLELRAFPPQALEGVEGHLLASVNLGSMPGHTEVANHAFDLEFTAPPAGLSNVALLLREWTSRGFLTRDVVNLEVLRVEEPVARVATPVSVPRIPAKPPAVTPSVRKPKGPVLVSVNKATAGELAEIKGLPEKVAQNIVKERPFRSLDELPRVKGMGEKLLAKIRSKLKL